MSKRVKLRWSGSRQAQAEADEAYAKLPQAPKPRLRPSADRGFLADASYWAIRDLQRIAGSLLVWRYKLVGNGEQIHVMVDNKDGERLINWWPTTGTVLYADNSKGYAKDAAAAVELAVARLKAGKSHDG